MELTPEEEAQLRVDQGIDPTPEKENTIIREPKEKPKTTKVPFAEVRGRRQVPLPESAQVHEALTNDIHMYPLSSRSKKDFSREETVEIIQVGGKAHNVVVGGKLQRGFSPPPQSKSSVTKRSKWRYKREEDRKQKDLKNTT